jgi:glutamate formiminotransferase/formiminotetrahydrofolate cyclodeaminase
MAAVVECVPNISEGKDRKVIDEIAGEVSKVEGATLLDVDPNGDYHRTVITFAGTPAGVVEAACRLTAKAAELIDMTRHAGEHPRLGMVDVCPFVPVSGVTMADCVRLAEDYGKRVADTLGIPVYLYEEAARTPKRKNLSDIRKGEYEGLEAKLTDPAWKPDFGEARFVPKSGAVVTGARFFLIAYNVNLKTPDVGIANEIALRIRESGRILKDERGDPVLDATGNKVKVPGTLKAVKGMGVYLEAQNITQVSMNLVNYLVTSPHVAFEEVRKQARSLGVEVTGSEIVGLVPKEALLMAGRFYGASPGNERVQIDTAIDRLGLSDLAPFLPEKKIIEYMIGAA